MLLEPNVALSQDPTYYCIQLTDYALRFSDSCVTILSLLPRSLSSRPCNIGIIKISGSPVPVVSSQHSASRDTRILPTAFATSHYHKPHPSLFSPIISPVFVVLFIRKNREREKKGRIGMSKFQSHQQ